MTTERYAELVKLPSLALVHEPGADARDCDTCVMSGDENAHTMRDYLPHGLSGLQPELDRIATCYPAEILADELVCWCGHSLHLPECPDEGACHMDDGPHVGWCRNQWTKRALRVPEHPGATASPEPPPVWRCPNEGKPHRAKLTVETDGRHCTVWCRDCMSVAQGDMATGTVEDVTDV